MDIEDILEVGAGVALGVGVAAVAGLALLLDDDI